MNNHPLDGIEPDTRSCWTRSGCVVPALLLFAVLFAVAMGFVQFQVKGSSYRCIKNPPANTQLGWDFSAEAHWMEGRLVCVWTSPRDPRVHETVRLPLFGW